MSTKPNYVLEFNKTAKEVKIVAEGLFTPKEVGEFLALYKQKISEINASEYILVADCSNLPVLSPAMTEQLVNTLSLYKETGFKKIHINVGDSSILSMQFSRLGREVGLTNLEIIKK